MTLRIDGDAPRTNRPRFGRRIAAACILGAIGIVAPAAMIATYYGSIDAPSLVRDPTTSFILGFVLAYPIGLAAASPLLLKIGMVGAPLGGFLAGWTIDRWDDPSDDPSRATP